jgi:hypothetical protein
MSAAGAAGGKLLLPRASYSSQCSAQLHCNTHHSSCTGSPKLRVGPVLAWPHQLLLPRLLLQRLLGWHESHGGACRAHAVLAAAGHDQKH